MGEGVVQVCYVACAQELFTALLMCPVADLGAPDVMANGQQKTCDITVADILGPLKTMTGASEAADSMVRARDDNFSLLSYSFSLVGPAAQPRTACG